MQNDETVQDIELEHGTIIDNIILDTLVSSHPIEISSTEPVVEVVAAPTIEPTENKENTILSITEAEQMPTVINPQVEILPTEPVVEVVAAPTLEPIETKQKKKKVKPNIFDAKRKKVAFYFRLKIFVWNVISMQRKTSLGVLFNLFQLLLVITTLVLFSLQSESTFQPYYDHCWCDDAANTEFYPVRVLFFIIEYVAVSFFTLEWVLRLFSCTAIGKYNQYGDVIGRILYLFSFNSIIEFITFFPAWLILFIKLDLYNRFSAYIGPTSNPFIFVTDIDSYQRVFILILVVSRTCGLLRLDRFFQLLSVVNRVVMRKSSELLSVFLLVIIVIYFVATLFWIIEGPIQPSKLGSIPRSIYFAVIVLSTCGFGDIVPLTWEGRILTIFVCVLAIAIYAIYAGVISSSIMEEIQAQNEINLRIQKETEEYEKQREKLRRLYRLKMAAQEKKRLELKKVLGVENLNKFIDKTNTAVNNNKLVGKLKKITQPGLSTAMGGVTAGFDVIKMMKNKVYDATIGELTQDPPMDLEEFEEMAAMQENPQEQSKPQENVNPASAHKCPNCNCELQLSVQTAIAIKKSE